MNIESFRSYCLAKAGVTEEFPFGDEVIVFKVLGKMFALADVEEFISINLKCDPEEAVLLREKYDGVQPGYHMNKKHWNTILMDGSIPDKSVLSWIDHSYDLVVLRLSKKLQESLQKKKKTTIKK